MTIDRNHPALINNNNTIFDLPIDETAQLITDAVAYYARQLDYVTANTSDSHIDDFMMISDILHQLMPLTTYALTELDDDTYNHNFETAFADETLLNNIIYFDCYNNCATKLERPQLFLHLNKLTEEQIDELADNL